MIPEIGHFALILALFIAFVQAVFPIVGAARGDVRWMAMARPAALTQFLFVALAYGCLTYAFITNDFSVAYVAENSNSALPLIYRIAGVWGAHEGSLLLWLLILNVWMASVAIFSRSLTQAFVARVLGVMGLISIGFLLFMLTTSDPFTRLLPAALQGRDLNPLLQDPGLASHPPMLYMGYVGFSVAFSFAIAALLGGQLDSAWARWSRPWTTAAWVFLTIGITLGSWWAYNELGWGGWWFWDPVENASFMPWLVGTALMHSLAVTEKRGVFKNWTVLLALFAFSLSLLGTFLVRSGVLTSVHAFAVDPARGVFILIFLGVVVGGSLLLYAWRAPRVRSSGEFKLLSRETLLLGNNIVLVVAACSVLLGTLYPLFLEALNLGKISVGPPYFDTVFVPLMVVLIVLLGIGPTARWKHDDGASLMRRLRVSLFLSLGAGVVALAVLRGEASIMVVVSVLLAAWIVFTTLANLRHRYSREAGLVRSLRRLPRGFVGMTLAHLGVAVFTLGVAFSGAYSSDKDVALGPGDSYTLSGYQFRFNGMREMNGPNYVARQASVTVSRDGRKIADLRPQKRIYEARGMPMTEAAVDVGLFRDLYVALGESVGDGRWSLRLYYKPFVRWIWTGALIMALGGGVAASDRRYRLARQRQAAAARSGYVPEGTA
jgi:cytochrome c-type biogenesis protein CcmF